LRTTGFANESWHRLLTPLRRAIYAFGIARALLLNPDILVMDEPFSVAFAARRLW
jgi:ABC-type taurine transport system ATPase subunit